MLVTPRLPGLPPKKLEWATRCVIVWAHRIAKEAILDDLKRQGLKVREYSAKEIAILADAYFDDHRDELLAKAAEQFFRRY
jgi:hypothetical protein